MSKLLVYKGIIRERYTTSNIIATISHYTVALLSPGKEEKKKRQQHRKTQNLIKKYQFK